MKGHTHYSTYFRTIGTVKRKVKPKFKNKINKFVVYFNCLF